MKKMEWDFRDNEENVDDLDTILPELESVKVAYYGVSDKERYDLLEDVRKGVEETAKADGFDANFHETGDVREMKPYVFGGLPRGGYDTEIDFILWLESDDDFRRMAKAYREYYLYSWFHDEVTGFLPEDIVAIVANRDGIRIGAYAGISKCTHQYDLEPEEERGAFWRARMQARLRDKVVTAK